MVVELCTRLVDLDAREARGDDGSVVSLSPGEVRLLARLLDGAPATVPRAELDALGAVDAAVARLRAKLERDPKRPDHLLTTFGEGYRLVGVRPAGAVARPRLADPGPLLGRDALLARLAAEVEAARCVWLSGAPGVGKTHLARAALAGRPGALVDLGGAVDVARAVATELGVPRRSLRATLASGPPGWLLLDDAEGVHDQLPAILPALAVGRVRVWVTSRRACPIPGVVSVQVPPLDPDHAADLFWTRTADVRPGLQADPVARERAASLLERLDGLPLAIELAAARVSALPLEHLTRRVADHLGVLSTRGRSLQAALALSWDLLDGPDRRVLAALSLFQGVFGPRDAEALGAPEAALAPLVNAHLVVRKAGGYRLLAPVRTFARARLEEDPEGLDAAARAFVAHLAPAAPRAGAHEGHLRDNRRRAPDLALAVDLARRLPMPERLVPLALALQGAWEASGAARAERLVVLRACLEVPGLPVDARVRLLGKIASVAEGPEGLAAAEQAVTEAGGSRLALGRALAARGDAAWRLGRLEEALADLERAWDLANPGSEFRETWIATALAEVLLQRGRIRGARDLLLGALASCRASASTGFGMYTLLRVADAERALGRYAAAHRALGEVAEAQGTTGSLFDDFNALAARGAWARNEGQYERSRHHYLLALGLARRVAGRVAVLHTEGNLALTQEVEGDLQGAAARLEEVEAGLRALGDVAAAGEARVGRARVALALGRVDEAAAVLPEPSGLTEPVVRAQARGLRAEVRARRGDGEGADAALARALAELEGTELVGARHHVAVQGVRVARVLGRSVSVPEIEDLRYEALLRSRLR